MKLRSSDYSNTYKVGYEYGLERVVKIYDTRRYNHEIICSYV